MLSGVYRYMSDKEKKIDKPSNLIVDILKTVGGGIISLGMCFAVFLCLCMSWNGYYCIMILVASLSYAIHEWVTEIRIFRRWIFFELLFYALLFASISFSIHEHSFNYDYRLDKVIEDVLPFLRQIIVLSSLIVVSVIIRICRKKKIHWQEWISLPVFGCFLLCGDNLFLETILFTSLFAYTIYEGYRRNNLLQIYCGLYAQIAWICFVLIGFLYYYASLNHYYLIDVQGNDMAGYSIIGLGLLLFVSYVCVSIKKKRTPLPEQMKGEVNPK